jgi:hypothetical protein
MARAPHRPTVYFDSRRSTTEQALMATLIATRRGRMARRLIGLAQLGMRVEQLAVTQPSTINTILASSVSSYCDRRFLKVALKLSESRAVDGEIVTTATVSGNKAGRIRELAMIGLRREAFLERQAENLVVSPASYAMPTQAAHEAFAAV